MYNSLGAGLTVLLGVCLGTAGLARADVLYIGVVHDATPGEVVLMMGTEQLPLAVTQQTSVTIDGRTATVESLRPGDRVSVRTEPAAVRGRVAVEIAARRTSLNEPRRLERFRR